MKGCQVVIDIPRPAKVAPELFRAGFALARKYNAAHAEFQLFPVDLLKPGANPIDGPIRLLFEVDASSDFLALSIDVIEFAGDHGALRAELRSWRVLLDPPEQAGEVGSSRRPWQGGGQGTIPADWTPEMDEEFRTWLNSLPDPSGETGQRCDAHERGSDNDNAGDRSGEGSGGQDGE